MHSDKKYLMTSAIGGEFRKMVNISWFPKLPLISFFFQVDFDMQSTYDNQMTISSIAELKGTGSTVGSSSSSAITHGWINTVPLSATSTLSKRNLMRSKQQAKNNDSFVKDYVKKRNLILDLLVSCQKLKICFWLKQKWQNAFLQAVQIEFLTTWNNPSGRPEIKICGEDTIAAWKSKAVSDKTLIENTRLAWDHISPVLAVFLPVRYGLYFLYDVVGLVYRIVYELYLFLCRLKNSDCIIREVSRLVRLNPSAVAHVPHALQYLVTTETILNDSPEVR